MGLIHMPAGEDARFFPKRANPSASLHIVPVG
jgi:hypothetical protein